MQARSSARADDEQYMRRALAQAEDAAERGEVPVGAVLVRDNRVIAEASNSPIGQSDPSAHAEILVLRAAAKADKNYRLPMTTLYVTIEPCAMCVGAIVHARVQRVVFGALEPKAGALVSNTGLMSAKVFNHRFEFEGGLLAEACGALMTAFFQERRLVKAQQKAQKCSLPPHEPAG